MSVIDEIKDLGYTLRESDNPERDPIDFTIHDEEDNVAWVYGDDHDVDFECSHPYDCIEFGSDREEQGECLLCGAFCDYHGVPDESGHAYPEPHEWYPRRNVGGVIGKYLDELRAKNA